MTATQLALYVIKNYSQITGRPDYEKHSEGDFPQEVYDLIDYHGVDVDDFQDAWIEMLG